MNQYTKEELQVIIVSLENKLHRMYQDSQIHNVNNPLLGETKSALDKTRELLKLCIEN